MDADTWFCLAVLLLGLGIGVVLCTSVVIAIVEGDKIEIPCDRCGKPLNWERRFGLGGWFCPVCDRINLDFTRTSSSTNGEGWDG